MREAEKVPGPQILASFTLSVPTGRFTFGERLARGHQGEQQEVPGPQILASFTLSVPTVSFTLSVNAWQWGHQGEQQDLNADHVWD